MDWLDYREKLGIGFKDTEKTQFCITQVFNALNSFIFVPGYDYVSFPEYIKYCNLVGASIDPQLIDDMYSDRRFRHCLNIMDRHRSYLEEFLSYYVGFINAIELNRDAEITREDYKNILSNALDAAHIPFELVSDGDNYFVFPKGAKELDDALVSEPLEWLKAYPNAHKTFVIALKQYSDGVYIRDTADNLRKALEAFLQEFLGNGKNLETNKIEICKYLGSQNVDAGIAGLFQPLINAYKNINDSLAKHNDAIDQKLLEFLLYQTGLLIRMVLAVKQAEQEDTNNAD